MYYNIFISNISLLIIISFLSQSFSLEGDNRGNLYKHEICSFSGVPEVIGNVVKCHCYEGFTNTSEPIDYFEEYPVQCWYKNKSRFITFWLSVCIPLGFDYLYLGHYSYFLIIIGVIIILFINYFVCFYLLKKIQKETDISEAKSIRGKDTLSYRGNGDEMDDNARKIHLNLLMKKKYVNKYKLCINIGFLLVLLFWITDAVLMGLGVVKDDKGFETYNDFVLLFSGKMKQKN